MQVVRITLILAAALAFPASGAATAAQIRLADDSPVRVVGWGFPRHERVTVRVAVSGKAPLKRVLTTTTTGRFDVRFAATSLGACDSFTITATSRSGASAKKIEIPPSCGIVPSP